MMPTITEPADIKRTTTAYYGVIGADLHEKSTAVRFLPDRVEVYWEDGEIERVTMSGKRVLKRKGPTNTESISFFPTKRGIWDSFGYGLAPGWLQQFVRDVVRP